MRVRPSMGRAGKRVERGGRNFVRAPIAAERMTKVDGVLRNELKRLGVTVHASSRSGLTPTFPPRLIWFACPRARSRAVTTYVIIGGTVAGRFGLGPISSNAAGWPAYSSKQPRVGRAKNRPPDVRHGASSVLLEVGRIRAGVAPRKLLDPERRGDETCRTMQGRAWPKSRKAAPDITRS
jgi:hypothetical protein